MLQRHYLRILEMVIVKEMVMILRIRITRLQRLNIGGETKIWNICDSIVMEVSGGEERG